MTLLRVLLSLCTLSLAISFSISVPRPSNSFVSHTRHSSRRWHRAGTISPFQSINKSNHNHQHKLKTYLSTTVSLSGGASSEERVEGVARQPRVIFVLGGPGAGKGTQCAKIVEHFDFIHLSVGDLLRLERSNPSSANGQLIESYLSEGKIVPVSISLTLVQKKMSTYPPSTIFLIDGFPRSLDNLTGWSSQMSDSCKTLSVLIYDCPLPILESRILLRGETSGRSDDNISSLKKRFMTFKSETIPVVKMLEESGVECVHISGENTLEEVWISTKNVIEELLKAELIERNELLNSGGHFKEIVDDDILESFINQGLWKSPIGEVEVEGKRATIKGEEGRRIWELRDGEWWMIHFSCAE